MINLTINDKAITVKKDTSILAAAKMLDIRIPTLCFMELECFSLKKMTGSCRICLVEVVGRPTLAPSCCTPVSENMEVKTNTIRVINARRTMLDLLLSDHPKDCLTCEKNLDCELQTLANEMRLHNVRYTGEQSEYPLEVANEAIYRDMNKCIMCRRCEIICNSVQTVGVLSGVGRGFGSVVSTADNRSLENTKCTFCGQCVSICPVGALTAINRTYDVWKALNNNKKTVIVQVAPAVRVALGEEFGMEPGTSVTGKMVTALKALGFDAVFDTDFAADLTIMEETTELIERVKENKNLPILTSCCPGWVKFLEHQFRDLLHIPSTAKSPQQMFGAIAKTYYAEKKNVKPEDLIVVSIMPCLAKKYEASREEFSKDGVRDVDIVISTRELAEMIKEAGLQLADLKNSNFDNPLGESTGAGVIFGSTGGVLEAALRTAADWITGEDLRHIDFENVRGMNGIKEATVKIADLELKVAVTSGLGNAREILNKIKSGDAFYHAIEIMACPGGCLNGGGQPYIHGDTTILEKRMNAIYDEDSMKTIRKSHQNPHIIKLYDEFLGEPGSKKAHDLLHTKYEARSAFL
jgi:NADH-quinone oxidoreductase subunit G